jgi:hypothetical protein
MIFLVAEKDEEMFEGPHLEYPEDEKFDDPGKETVKPDEDTILSSGEATTRD